MKCHIPGPNVRVMGRTVHALARFGDELYLEALSDCILLRTLNAAESAYSMVKFNKNFFSYFNYNYYSIEDNDGLKCKISMKSALHTFKSPAHMDKQVENLEMKLDPENCKLVFTLKCKHGIVKTHFVSILECKSMQEVHIKDIVPNRITSPQKVLSEALGNFQSSDDQITFEVSEQCLTLKNYGDGNIEALKITRTKISIKATEFDSYTIGLETHIKFTMKELRALLTFAEALNLPVQIQFETTGKPVVFIVHNGSTFEAHFVLATSKPDSDTEVDFTPNTSHIDRKRKEYSNIMENAILKKPHLNTDMNIDLDEDSHLFNFIEMPGDNKTCNGSHTNQTHENSIMDCDNIPDSPASKINLQSVFKRCFESTFDPRSVMRTVLAENSDSD